MTKYKIRTNGRGNAWPILLGKTHKLYNIKNVEDYANASFSIIKYNISESIIEKELLIDAGHGAIQYLLKHNNRIPEAIVLTHPHIDHSLSIDWIVQSYYKSTKTKYPLYASKMCWDLNLQFFPHLKNIVNFKEILPGKQIVITELDDLKLTFYPVFHGESALGAGMLYFEFPEYNNFKKVLFTGDLLCPLLRKDDYETLKNCDIVYADSNNRFPYPNSNHWSLSFNDKNNIFGNWQKAKLRLSYLIRPNLPVKFNKHIHNYFEQIIKEDKELCFSVLEFANKINAKNVNLIHYSGSEDKKHYKKEILTEKKLAKWTNIQAKKQNIKSKFFVPKVSDIFVCRNNSKIFSKNQ